MKDKAATVVVKQKAAILVKVVVVLEKAVYEITLVFTVYGTMVDVIVDEVVEVVFVDEMDGIFLDDVPV